jgi:hypothetical protein
MVAMIPIEHLESHFLGRSACRDGRVAAAIVAGTVPTVGRWCGNRRPIISDWTAVSSADDDTVVVANANVAAVLPVEGSTHVPPRQDDQLVPSRQKIGLADIDPGYER